jgi:hypothetical protein
MRRIGLLTLITGCFVLAAGQAVAGHTPTMRTSGFYSYGARSDITVPYLTTGRSTFMPGAVAPQILIEPNVDNVRYPQTVPVFNLPFYGARQGFGDQFNGAELKTMRIFNGPNR